ncbi:ABC transporter permease [Ilumatobacter sp.]|uniref:ABC transporter permease n=1 Tax=Ilumatobacter sp. TaxID=1967498 RepID=UPI003B516B87
MSTTDSTADDIPDLGPQGGSDGESATDVATTADEEIVPMAEVGPSAAAADRKQVRRERLLVLAKTPGFIVGMLILLFWTAAAIVPTIFTTNEPNEAVRVDGSTIPRAEPQADAWFGTDSIGNDVFARVIHGARPIILLAVVAALLAVVAGTLLGLVVGYYRGWVDEILSRVIEAFLSIPVILLAIMVLTLFGRSSTVLIATIALLFTPVVARTIRSAVIAEGQLDYVTSAKLRGESSIFVMTREILPNITGVAVVELTVRVGYAIFTVATLAFLGLSAGDSSAANWGTDITKQYKLIQSGQWWSTIFPALAIASLVIGVNLVADSIDRANKS